ncbi:MAG: MFS transporter [Alphaproteobacteria bacterium]|nr:MFS transporter [Alphaproteobacteria bacterium]
MDANRTLQLRLAGFYGAFFTTAGINVPFFPVWLAAQGLAESAIGLVMAVGAMARVAALPIAGHVVDVTGRRRAPILVLTWCSLAAYGLYHFASAPWHYVAIAFLFGFFTAPQVSLMDSLTMLAVRARQLDYGRIRVWGSITFMIVALIFGFMLQGRDAGLIWQAMMAGLVLTVGVAFILPDWQVEEGARRARAPLTAVLSDPRFRIFVLGNGLTQASHALFYVFGSIYWRQAGLSDGFIGFLWAEGVIAEIIFFVYGDRLVRRFGPAWLLLFAGIGGVVRWTLTAATTDPVVLVLVQPLHALTFAAGFQASIHFVARTLAPELSASAQSLSALISTGLMLAPMMWLVGPLYHAAGPYAYLAMAGLSLGAAAVAVVMLRRLR